MLIVAVFIA